MGKAKLIKSTEGQKSNPEGKWHVHDQIKPFIQGIITGDLDIQQVSSALISGVPTPWARAKLFWFAFDYLQRNDTNISTSGLIEFYKILTDEWKGLIALTALYPDRISFSEPIYMNPKDKDLYEISSAFGRMLMDDADIWTDQQKKQISPDEQPFVQLLRYNNQVIGSTSPFSIVFSGVDYSKLQHANDIPWFRNGKLEDPMRYLDKDKLQKLYLFIKNININFIKYEDKINISRLNNKLDLSGLKSFLRQWQKDIESKESALQKNGTVAKYSNLVMPFNVLLASYQKVYQLQDGSFTFDEPTDKSLIKSELSDLQNILKEDRKIIGWFESDDYKNPLSNAAVYYLKVNDVRDTDNQIKYFALPLSMEGIQMFTQQLSRLVSHQDPKFDIIGKISEQGNLIVDLTVDIDSQPYKLNSKEYEIEWATPNSKVIMWPNFISDNWDAYYLYSEYPLNVQGLKFIPFYKQGQEQKIITVVRPHGNKTEALVVYANSSEDFRKDAGLIITNLITYPAGQVPQEMHKYEVIQSNRPIAGLEIRIENAGKSQLAGYLIVKNPGDTTMGIKKIVDLSTAPIINEAIVGIDFGSNNSCVHYTLKTDANNGASPILFKNRRLSLVGVDSESGLTAERDELLFFSNEPTPNGQIKSWLHEHDVRYIGAYKDKEIAGGVAVNEKNILVKEMDKEKIVTQAGTLNYNMKWLSDIAGVSKKTAYLKALWLSICADLYADKYRPTELRWSFPGSMSSTDLNQYNAIYNGQLPSLTPISDSSTKARLRPTTIVEQTEAEAVCKYALSKDQGLNNNMFLGIDVGGSTSDILLLAKDINANNVPKLYKQSSVRIAAGVFFDAVIKSTTFRKAIFDYHEQQTRIKVENIKDILSEGHKAPFYLNSVFDQLTDDDFGSFYSYIGREASFAYAIPAYVTGLLVFYSGKLCAKTIKENNLTAVKEIHLLPFGKGGRLFHWLQTIPGSSSTNEYYETCFRKGYGDGAEAIRLKYRTDISEDNKSEVSKGLAVDAELIYDRNVRFTSDIFAEKNIKYLRDGQFVEFDENAVVDDEYFENIGQFEFPDRLENFEEFLRIFINFVGHKAGLVKDIASLENRSKELSGLVSAFIQNDAEYKKARNAKQQSNKFEYRFPILIAEGLCYLEKILIPEVFKA
ncbi:hypothetical protein Barb6_00239 [Bacteroidales bacterium Barb6]|nr:hypothetical protein Barb6_00239 [Bacteroidales bacterium Barb6]